MAQLGQVASEGLHWVREELNGGLERVRGFIEDYLDAPANPLPLQRSLVDLHQIRGTLRMIQCEGAALLAEEMKVAVQDLLENRDDAPEKAFEALLGATLQLADYLDLLAAGERDNGLVFLPLINELRVARGANVVSESALFTRYLQMEGVEPPPSSASERGENAGREVARRAQSPFQAALLRVLKDQDVEANLARLDRAVTHVADAVSHPRGEQLFRTAAALLEAVADGGLAVGLDVKRLLGRVGQQLKALGEQGDAVMAEVPDELLYGLVYHVGCAESDGARVAALHETYALAQRLPPTDELERLRGRMRGPNTGLVQKLSTAIREDLTAVKDQIDLVVRAGDKADVALDDTVAATERIADTLAMLGLDMLHRIALNQARAIERLASTGSREDDAWMDVATALLRVEHSLDTALFRHMRGEAPVEGEADAETLAPEQDITEGTQAIHREALVNLSRVKTLVPDFLDRGEAHLLGEAGRLLHEVEAGLMMVGEDVAAPLVQRLHRFVNSQTMLRAQQRPRMVMHLADAIAALEYYLEARQSAQEPPAGMLDRVSEHVDRLEVPEGEAAPAYEPQAEGERPHRSAAASPDTVDPEIREVFLEEADEVLATLRREVPAWSRDIDDITRLVEIRRAFHTLKGSGRMVGAEDIGEFGWAVENLLNQCLEGAMDVSGEIAEVVRRAVDVLPQLIDDFRAGRRPEAADPIIERAHRLAGHPLASDEDAGPDRDLFNVFKADAETHIETVEAFAARTPPQAPDKDVVRALHTLRGSAETAQAIHIARLAGALEQYLDASLAEGQRVGAEGLSLLTESAQRFRALLDRRSAGKMPAEDAVDDLVERVAGMAEDLPSTALEASADHELRVVFTDEAAELLDRIEAGVRDWRTNPDDEHYPRLLADTCHTLKGSARTAEAEPIGIVAQGLEGFFRERLAEGRAPDEAEFEHLFEVLDTLFEMLDGFRRTGETGSSEAAGERLRALGVSVPASPPTESHDAEPEARAEPAPGIDTAAEPEAPATEETAAEQVAEDERAAAEADVAETLQAGDESEATGGAAEAQTETRAGVPETAPEEEAPDPELLEIFLGEAEELLEGIDGELERWQARPDDDAPREELMRLLHTMKGSARMAHLRAVGDASHDLETLLTRSRGEGYRGDLAETLRTSVDGLHRMIDEVRAGDVQVPEADYASSEPCEAPAEEAEPEPADESSEASTVSADTDQVAATDETDVAAATRQEFDPRLFWEPPQAEEERASTAEETARVPVERLDAMLNEAGEISIFRSRLEQENASLHAQLREMSQTTARMREQLRKLDMETEAQILARHEPSADRYEAEFDPLEMDRYSTLHELSRGLSESVSDLASLHGTMSYLADQTESLLVQQGRVNTSLQQGLTRTLMVPFSRQVRRLERVVRQTARENGRQARAEFTGIEAELDRHVLERMVAPLEHLLRNAVVHGIEPPDERRAVNKPGEGVVHIDLYREGTQLVIEVSDDGRGLDYEAIREVAARRGLLPDSARLTDAALAQFIFEPGFSTAGELTQAAGRGVGLDVVNAEIKQLGGNMAVESDAQRGARFAIRLPLTLAISQALMVEVGEETHAVPLGSIEGVTRVPVDELDRHVASAEESFEYGGQRYRVHYLADLLGVTRDEQREDRNLPVLLARAGERRVAFAVDVMHGSREVVVKPVGPQVSTVPVISGATVLADGSVVLILDVPALMQAEIRRAARAAEGAEIAETADERPLIMVVDDSVTIRRVSERFLSRNGFRVALAKDGMDALAQLQTTPPDAVLLDLEMPRIDGFELATYMRNSEQLRHTPIVVITSRSGEKHRRRAEQIGVERFLTKPYQEQDLLAQIHVVLRPREAGE